MSSYSGVERRLARLLSGFPVVKQSAKWCYSRLVYLKFRKKYKVKAIHDIQVVGISENEPSFFGYYDKSPVNSLGVTLFCTTSQMTQDIPSKADSITLRVVNANNENIMELPVKSYNWQQGCRAHWLNDDLFILNDFCEKTQSYVAKVYSQADKEQVKEFDCAVQDSFGTDYFLSINYRRLMALRPDYGYRNLSPMTDPELENRINDGIWKVDYMTGNSILLVSIENACEINPHDDFHKALHKINHVMISPDGEKFIFMHRYLIGQIRHDRLFMADAASGELTLLSDYGMVSHCFWVNSDTILGYMRGPEGKDAYWKIDLNTITFSSLCNGALDSFGDGHPHVHGDWLVTDTYPDKSRMQRLMLANWKTGEVIPLGEFFHGFEYSGESRCDLHPRISVDGKSVFFDSVFSGQRQLYRMNLPI